MIGLGETHLSLHDMKSFILIVSERTGVCCSIFHRTHSVQFFCICTNLYNHTQFKEVCVFILCFFPLDKYDGRPTDWHVNSCSKPLVYVCIHTNMCICTYRIGRALACSNTCGRCIHAMPPSIQLRIQENHMLRERILSLLMRVLLLLAISAGNLAYHAQLLQSKFCDVYDEPGWRAKCSIFLGNALLCSLVREALMSILRSSALDIEESVEWQCSRL